MGCALCSPERQVVESEEVGRHGAGPDLEVLAVDEAVGRVEPLSKLEVVLGPCEGRVEPADLLHQPRPLRHLPLHTTNLPTNHLS